MILKRICHCSRVSAGRTDTFRVRSRNIPAATWPATSISKSFGKDNTLGVSDLSTDSVLCSEEEVKILPSNSNKVEDTFFLASILVVILNRPTTRLDDEFFKVKKKRRKKEGKGKVEVEEISNTFPSHS